MDRKEKIEFLNRAVTGELTHEDNLFLLSGLSDEELLIRLASSLMEIVDVFNIKNDEQFLLNLNNALTTVYGNNARKYHIHVNQETSNKLRKLIYQDEKS